MRVVEKSLYRMRSSNKSFLHNLCKEAVGCDDLDTQVVVDETPVKNAWVIKRTYLGMFSCEEGINKLIKAHITEEE